jgi:NADP-dependent 3-hydroxy acid dehydrogenase YdfG
MVLKRIMKFIVWNKRMSRLINKVAIITGAANGQGREDAILFAKHGVKIVATDINQEGLNEIVKLISYRNVKS